MLFALFGLLLLVAVGVAILRAVVAFQRSAAERQEAAAAGRDPGLVRSPWPTTIAWLVGLPMLVVVLEAVTFVILFARSGGVG